MQDVDVSNALFESPCMQDIDVSKARFFDRSCMPDIPRIVRAWYTHSRKEHRLRTCEYIFVVKEGAIVFKRWSRRMTPRIVCM